MNSSKLEHIISASKKALKKVTIAGIAALCIGSTSQNASASMMDKDDAVIIASNAVFNGIIAGIGAYERDQPVLEAFIKGTVGGTMIGAGKYIVAKDANMAWPAKITTSIGTAIVSNTAQGKGVFDRIGIDLGPFYFTVEKDSGGEYTFKPLLIPDALGAIAFTPLKGFSLSDSLRYGTPVFYEDLQNTSIYGMTPAGLTRANVIRLDRKMPSSSSRKIKSHEIGHTLQWAANGALAPSLLGPTLYPWSQRFYDNNYLHLDQGIGHVPLMLPQLMLPYNNRPFESEMYHLADQHR